MDREAPALVNWDGSVVQPPAAIAYPRNVDDLVAIMRDPQSYPSPIRAIGSNHSATFCTVCDGGTAVSMQHFDRILAIHDDTVTVEAGALYIDVAQELRRHGKQFHVNLEIGCLSVGTAACGGTKDSSMAGELGQVCSYAIAMKLVAPTGERLQIDRDQPELLGAERSLPDIRARGDSMFMYLFPFNRELNVEFRSYGEGPAPAAAGWRWGVRNYFWASVLPYVGYVASRYIGWKRLRYFAIDAINRFIIFLMRIIMKAESTSAADQMIRFPPRGGRTKYSRSKERR